MNFTISDETTKRLLRKEFSYKKFCRHCYSKTEQNDAYHVYTARNKTVLRKAYDNMIEDMLKNNNKK